MLSPLRTSSFLSGRLATTTQSSKSQLCHLIARAGGDAPKASEPSTDAEARLELLESQLKGKKSQIAQKRRAIPIRGQTPVKEDAASNMREWKEGQLFPEGWETMQLPEKVTELYMGRRGFLFWTNKLAYTSVFVLIFAWVVFRFIGPNIGLYSLPGDSN